MQTNLLKIQKTLKSHYGDLNWWPAKTPYEVIIGAILTQNTNWSNVEKAIANFAENLTPQFVAAADFAELSQIIRPPGFFNQKTVYLKAATQWYAKYSYSVENVRKIPLATLRSELLATKGIGQETADSILLYAFNLPTFVIDAYTHRLFARYSIDVGKNYTSAKTFFEDNLPKDVQLYNEFHALIVINAKEHCKKKPICAGCPLAEDCRKIF